MGEQDKADFMYKLGKLIEVYAKRISCRDSHQYGTKAWISDNVIAKDISDIMEEMVKAALTPVFVTPSLN